VSLNIQTFKIRTIAAIIFAAVMLFGLMFGVWSFIILFTIVHFGCWYEFIRLMKKINPGTYLLYSTLGIFYITMPILMMLSLGIRVYDRPEASNELLYFPLLPCAIIISLWINDTMAYIVGSMIGKTPFSKISPKKTWEGTAGGAILCVIVIALLGYFLPVANSVNVIHWIAIAGICAVFGILGDLLESKLKRIADVKDSGHFMPGHGGFLDRFDSMLIATPAVFLYVLLT
jgi:phosphatidate cytidylyltransferase